jgi:Flp pilus assembly protein TadD
MRGLLLATMLVAPLFGGDARQEEARRLYERADFQGSLQILTQLAQKDAASLELLGRAYFMLGDYKKAINALQEAVTAEPGGSDHYLWLGHAYGRRAEHCSPLTAPASAVKARQNFEKAVELNPRNLEAMSDLLEYYLEAPGFLGGGLDKAAALAKKIAALDPAEGHYAQHKLAEKNGDRTGAEQGLRRAAAVAPQQPGRLIDLAKFLARQGRYEESDRLFQTAESIGESQPKILFERADSYIRSGRNLDTARQLLKRYLGAQLTPDDPPRHEAEKLLKKLSA